MTDTFNAIILGTLGGFVPALIWLFFWLREDSAHPEPRKRIAWTFIGGMIAVPFALVLQILVNITIQLPAPIELLAKVDIPFSFMMLFIWAFIEELLKFGAAFYFAIHKRVSDEAIDVPIYAITAALGFAALENILFIINPLLAGNTTEAFITGNMRFIGATLLHVATSAIVGMSIGFAYFRGVRAKKRHFITGLFIATLLHTLFNLFIILDKTTSIAAFAGVWTLIVVIIVLFEKIKSIHLNKI